MQQITTSHFEYVQFMAKFAKDINTVEEFNMRHAIFAQVDLEISAHNSMPANYTLGHNQFSDWTREEYGNLLGLRHAHNEDHPVVVFDESNAADEVNWVTNGGVSPVKDQGQCGSCWSFSTTGAMEGAHFVASGNLVSLSESNLVDCSWLNHGCNGGMMDLAFRYAETYPLETEANYPYKASTGIFACKYDKSKGAVQVKTYNDVTPKSSDAFKAALQNGPVSVAIEADQAVFHQYTGGIITSTSCGTSLDHGVLTVGYGVDAKVGEYYIVKNSWTTGWGEAGYVRIAVADGAGICGIQSQPSYPVTN